MIFYEEVLREFFKQKIRYVLVGGIAMNLQGVERATADLDILVDMTDGNLANVVKILQKQGYSVKQPVNPMGIAQKKTREDWIKNKNMKAFNFYKEDYKEVDIIIDSPVSYSQASKEMLLLKVDNLVVPVISIRHLIKMKKVAGRDIDSWDIKQLEKISKIRKKK